jgi:hypothetical protein
MILDIIQLINNCPSDVPSYTSAQMRRKAAQSIAALATAQPAYVHHQLTLCGYRTKENWENIIVNCLYDVRTRQAAGKISICFDVTAIAPTAFSAMSTLTTQATESSVGAGADDSETTHSADTSSLSSNSSCYDDFDVSDR